MGTESFVHLAHNQGAFVSHPTPAPTTACSVLFADLPPQMFYSSLCCDGCCEVQVRSSTANDTEVYSETATGDVVNERVLDDFTTGLNTTTFCVLDVQPIERLAVKIVIKLHCNAAATPWCDQS